MRNFYLFKSESCSDNLLKYPCREPNGLFLENRTVAIFDTFDIVNPIWFSKYGADVIVNPSDEEMTKAKIAVLMPNYGKDYYEVLDYYVHHLQKLVRSMKGKHNYKHVIVVLPAGADIYSTELPSLAHYAVSGLIKGLGKLYAPFNLYVNGIILNESDTQKYLQEYILYLASDNSCNTVGQIIKL